MSHALRSSQSVFVRLCNAFVALSMALFLVAPASAAYAKDDYCSTWEEYKATLPADAAITWNTVADAMDILLDAANAAFEAGDADAAYKAVNAIIQVENDLTEFSVMSVTRGIDALGEVTVRVLAPDGQVFTGRGADGDIIVSSTKAYLNALNRLIAKSR